MSFPPWLPSLWSRSLFLFKSVVKKMFGLSLVDMHVSQLFCHCCCFVKEIATSPRELRFSQAVASFALALLLCWFFLGGGLGVQGWWNGRGQVLFRECLSPPHICVAQMYRWWFMGDLFCFSASPHERQRIVNEALQSTSLTLGLRLKKVSLSELT